MPDDVDRNERIGRFLDVMQMMRSGSGTSTFPDVRRQTFYEMIASGEFENSGLSRTALALQENISRLCAHARMPRESFTFGRRFEQVRTQLCLDNDMKPAMTSPNTTWDLAERQTWYSIEEKLTDWILFEEDVLKRYPGAMGAGSSLIAGIAAIDVIAPCETMIPEETSQRHLQVAAFGGSLIIGAWTLFESLSEDLWEAALNSHPTILADLGGKSKLTFDDLQKSGFDVRIKMGTLLKRKQIVGFRSIYDIRESYKLAFTEQHKSIEAILHDKDLQYAAAVRNVLIHKGGIIDAEFDEQTAGIPEAPKFDPKGPPVDFPIKGEICARLTDACCTSACWLVNAVHAWIIGHPETIPTPVDGANCDESTSGSSSPTPS